MEKKKKKQFIRPTVRLLEDVEALPLLAGSENYFGDAKSDGTDATITTDSEGNKYLTSMFPGGF